MEFPTEERRETAPRVPNVFVWKLSDKVAGADFPRGWSGGNPWHDEVFGLSALGVVDERPFCCGVLDGALMAGKTRNTLPVYEEQCGG